MRTLGKILFLFMIGASAFALERGDPGSSSNITLKHREKKGVGYSDGYSTIGLFFTPQGKRIVQPFSDLRGHIFNDGRFAGNFGGGFRFSNGPETWAFGTNFYADYREFFNSPLFQVGMGFEALSEEIDFRVNGYLPVGKKVKVAPLRFKKFKKFEAVFIKPSRGALGCVDAEIGFPLPAFFTYLDVYLGLGGYYLFERNLAGKRFGGDLGGKFRVTARILDGVLLGIDTTFDHEFGGILQGYVALSFPLGPANERTEGRRFRRGGSQRKMRYLRRMTQPVVRNEIIPGIEKDVECKVEEFSAIFVNNTAFPGGDGSFESPYNTLALAETNSEPGDIIYVFRGDGTVNNYNTGITLKNNQRLIGSGTSFEFGSVLIPASTPGFDPVITSFNPDVNAAVVMLNLNNEVAGMEIRVNNITSIGLANTTFFAPIGDPLVRDNNFTNPGFDPTAAGISLSPTDGGVLFVQNNTLTNFNAPIIIDVRTTTQRKAIVENNFGSIFGGGGVGMTLIHSSTLATGNSIFEARSNFIVNGGVLVFKGVGTLGTMCNDFVHNSLIAAPYVFQNDSAGSLQVEVPVPALGGLSFETLNVGTFTSIGTITFVVPDTCP